MPYSTIAVVALLIHFLINFDSFRKRDGIMAIKSYRIFVIVIAVFYASDILWGIFETNKLGLALTIDTNVYFVSVALTVFFWIRFVVDYLETDQVFGKILKIIGTVFLIAEIVLLIINLFYPIVFHVDSSAVYSSYWARDMMLFVQIGIYFLLALYSIIYTFKHRRNTRRHLAIISFSIIMLVAISIQVIDPYFPLYCIGCLVGICILTTYAINDSKETIKEELSYSVRKNQRTEERLGNAMHLAYTDSQTGVNSKYAYVELEERYDKLIANKEINEFAVAVFDLNGLKQINDTLGHKAGDKYILDSVNLIAKYFPHDDIYRYGGDEFVVVLEGDDYAKRKEYFNSFEHEIDENVKKKTLVISSGMSIYKADQDNTFKVVFNRADKMMYARKVFLKEQH